MDQKSSQIRRSQWEQIVLEGNNASISKKDWCQQNGINPKSFYYWQRKIRKATVEALEESETTAPIHVSDSASAPSFVELSFPSLSQAGREPVPPQNLLPELMVQIGNCQIYVNASIQKQTLDTVMKVIRNA